MYACRPILSACIITLFLVSFTGTAGCTGALPASPAAPVPGTPQGAGAPCGILDALPHIPAPVDTSVPVQDPVPGIRYSIPENESGRTIILEKGEIVEINLRWIPSLAMRWNMPVSGCGIELVNDGYFDTGTDYWNTSARYRARYRAVGPGTSTLDGKFVISPQDPVNDATPRFNLTVIVK